MPRTSRRISARQRTDLLATRIGLPAGPARQVGGVGVEARRGRPRRTAARGAPWPAPATHTGSSHGSDRRAEHAVEVVVGEHAGRVELVPQRDEVGEPRVPARELRRRRGGASCPSAGARRPPRRRPRRRRRTAGAASSGTGGRRCTRSVAGTSGPAGCRRRRRTGTRTGRPPGASSPPSSERKLAEHVAEPLARNAYSPSSNRTSPRRREHPVRQVGVLAGGSAPASTKRLTPRHQPRAPGGDPQQRVPADVGDDRLVEPVRQAPRPAELGVAGSRWNRRVSAVSVWGNQKNSKWSLSSTRSSNSSSTRSSGIGVVDGVQRERAARTASVTLVMTPRAPSPTRAASNSSGALVGVAVHDRAVGDDQFQRTHLGGDARRTGRRCRGCRWRSRRRPSAGRCRRGSPWPARARSSSAVEPVQRDPGPDRHEARRRVRRRPAGRAGPAAPGRRRPRRSR